MDLYADDFISRDELAQKLAGIRSEIGQLEAELQSATFLPTRSAQLENILQQTFQKIEDIVDVHQMTNAQLKRIIQKIEVDKTGNVDIYLRLLEPSALEKNVLVSHIHT